MKDNSEKQIGPCKDCIFFNFKSSSDARNYGYCLNDENVDKEYVYVSVNPGLLELKGMTRELYDEVREYFRKYECRRLNEDIMGCINFEKREEETKE